LCWFLFRYDKTIMALCVGIHPELSPWEGLFYLERQFWMYPSTEGHNCILLGRGNPETCVLYAVILLSVQQFIKASHTMATQFRGSDLSRTRTILFIILEQ